MPIQLDRSRTAAMAARFAEAADLVASEFGGLDSHRQYRNAFARLLKWDPLGRVLMMGTDQRDLFVPVLRGVIAGAVPPNGTLFDVGCGDGQTFALLADAVPPGTVVSFADPNPDYVTRYRAVVEGLPGLACGSALVAGFEAIDGAPGRPADGSVDLVLALHMIYFLDDPERDLRRMYGFLRPGGTMVVIVADEARGYTARCFEAFASGRGDDPRVVAMTRAMAERLRLLDDSAAALAASLAAACPDRPPAVELQVQPSRLYGHSLADLIALSNIAELSTFEGIDKFEPVVALLRDSPEQVDLRIENDGPRQGMLSVSQAQNVALIRKPSD